MAASPRGDVTQLLRSLAHLLIYRVPGERDSCPACESHLIEELDLLPLRRARHGRYVGFVSLCGDCGLVFSNPLPSEDDLNAFYRPGGEWRAGAATTPAAASEPRGLSWAKPFDPIRADLRVTRPPAGARVLDFGCGSGKLLDSFQDHGWDTTGIEPATDEAFRRHRRLTAVP